MKNLQAAALIPRDQGHRNDFMKKALSVTVMPPTVSLAPPEVLQLVKSDCLRDNLCSTKRVVVLQHAIRALQRSAVCGCNNDQTFYV